MINSGGDKLRSNSNATLKLFGLEIGGVPGFLVGGLLVAGLLLYVVAFGFSVVTGRLVSLSPTGIGVQASSPTPTVELTHRVEEKSFSSASPEAALISEDATFCALSMVDDDAPAALCEVIHTDGKWYVRTGGDGSINACKATCVWLDAKVN